MSGDFSRASLSSTLPTFTQYVICHTRDNKTLDLLYANSEEAYNSSPLPPLGRSDHNLVHLLPVYKPLVNRQPVESRWEISWGSWGRWRRWRRLRVQMGSAPGSSSPVQTSCAGLWNISSTWAWSWEKCHCCGKPPAWYLYQRSLTQKTLTATDQLLSLHTWWRPWSGWSSSISALFYGPSAVCISTQHQSGRHHHLTISPSLDPVQVVAESRMMDKMSSQLVKESNLQVTITAAGRSFSDSLTHKCVKERYRRSFLLLSDCTTSAVPVELTCAWCHKRIHFSVFCTNWTISHPIFIIIQQHTVFGFCDEETSLFTGQIKEVLILHC